MVQGGSYQHNFQEEQKEPACLKNIEQGGPKGGGPLQPGLDVQRPTLYGRGLPAVVVQGGCRGQGRLGPAGGVQGAEEGGGGRGDHHLLKDQTRWLFWKPKFMRIISELELKSSGPAGHHQGHTFGKYELVISREEDNCPVYKQADSEKIPSNKNYLLYR